MKLIITVLDNGYTLSVHTMVDTQEVRQRFAFETKEALNRKIQELLNV